MPLRDAEEKKIDEALRTWRQGDVSLDAGLEVLHLADLTRAHSPASLQVADAMEKRGEVPDAGAVPILDEVRGVVMLSQTCDVVRGCRKRPFVEVAPLIELSEHEVENVRRLKRPAFAYVSATAEDRLVADLERTMTVEKALVAEWTRTLGCQTDSDLRAFALALARKRSRFAFPDDFVTAADVLQRHLVGTHNKMNEEGSHLRALREIRVDAAPSWGSDMVHLSWWFVTYSDLDIDTNWPRLLELWLALFDQSGRFRVDASIACRLEVMTARDYVESDRLDLDRLSISRRS